MTTTTLPPNHHADHPGFRGVGGLAAALCFSIGRGADATLAVRLTGLGPGDRVVDIGCGPGVAARLAAGAGAAGVVGIDPAPVMLRVARLTPRRRRSATVRYAEGVAEDLPLDDDSATVVWSLSTVHHWRDIDRGLAEVCRVLAPGGRLLAVERRTAPGSTGYASHGWTDRQAEAFAERCRAAGFEQLSVGTHRTSRDVIAVLARRPDRARPPGQR